MNLNGDRSSGVSPNEHPTSVLLRAVLPRPLVLLLAGFLSLAPLSARAQFATILDTTSRFAGNSTGTGGFNQDSGVATATTLNVPSYIVFDSLGNLYISDTQNNCVRKVDTTGHVSTVAGLRVSGGPDTCNTASNPGPDPTEGLLRPPAWPSTAPTPSTSPTASTTACAAWPAARLNSFAANALTTVAGTCTIVTTNSETLALPIGLAVDSSANLYISIVGSGTGVAVNQVVRHLASAPQPQSAPLRVRRPPMQPQRSVPVSPALSRSTAPPALPSTRMATSSSPTQTTTACARSPDSPPPRPRLGNAPMT